MKQEKTNSIKRINILVRDEQYARVQQEGLNLSGLIRDLLDDRFSDKLIPLSVSPKTRALYDKIVSNFGVTDEEIEKHFVGSLDVLLQEKISAIESVRKQIKN